MICMCMYTCYIQHSTWRSRSLGKKVLVNDWAPGHSLSTWKNKNKLDPASPHTEISSGWKCEKWDRNFSKNRRLPLCSWDRKKFFNEMQKCHIKIYKLTTLKSKGNYCIYKDYHVTLNAHLWPVTVESKVIPIILFVWFCCWQFSLDKHPSLLSFC